MTSVTGLFDTNMKRLYMYDKPGHHGRPPCESHTADSILFEKEDVFFFVRLLSRPSAGRLAGWHKYSDIKIKHIYVYIYIYIYIYMSTKTLIIDTGVALDVQTFLIYTEML